MKITFIQPGIGKKENEKYPPSWCMFPPKAFSILKALTPPGIVTEFYDDRKELIDFHTKTNLAAITVEACTAMRAYQISTQFRKRKIPVIMGGSQATFIPEEVKHYSDSIYIGNAEDKWHEVIKDLKKNKLKKMYIGKPGFKNIIPDNSIFKNKKYLPVNLVETGRGCYYDCSICSISKYYKSKYYPRDIDDIIKEIKSCKGKYFFLLDDNMMINPDHMIELYKKLTPFKIKWVSQASINIAKNPEMLKWAYKSGCRQLFIGFESLETGSLRQIKKAWNLNQLEEYIKIIHDTGISVYASFVFGFDYDTKASFEKVLDFSEKHGFQMATYYSLLPYPNTKIYYDLKKEKRLLNEKWWLNPDYKFGNIPYIPKNMNPEKLKNGCIQARKKFFSFSSIFKRSRKFISITKDPVLLMLFLGQNFKLHFDVNKKVGIPFGKNLDKMPK